MKAAPQTTTDADELQRFNRLAATWWDPDGPMWPLHLLNRFRVRVIEQVLRDSGVIAGDSSQPLQGLDVLDIGCGGGILLESLARLGARVTGVDPAANNIAIARQHAESEQLEIRYLQTEVGELNGQFDLVFNLEVVEHVANLEAFMQASCERLKPGGTQFLSTINRTCKSYVFAILGAEYVLRLLPKGTHQWHKFVRPEELTQLLQQQGLATVWSSGVALNPFNRRYRLTKSHRVNYMLAAQRPAAQR